MLFSLRWALLNGDQFKWVLCTSLTSVFTSFEPIERGPKMVQKWPFFGVLGPVQSDFQNNDNKYINFKIMLITSNSLALSKPVIDGKGIYIDVISYSQIPMKPPKVKANIVPKKIPKTNIINCLEKFRASIPYNKLSHLTKWQLKKKKNYNWASSFPL